MFIVLCCCLLVKVQPLSLAWVGLHDIESLWVFFQEPIIEFQLGYPIFYLGTSIFYGQLMTFNLFIFYIKLLHLFFFLYFLYNKLQSLLEAEKTKKNNNMPYKDLIVA